MKANTVVSNNYPKRALSVKDAAMYAGVSENIVYHWITSGQIPYEDLPGSGKCARKFVRIRMADLNTFLDSHYKASQPSQKTRERPKKPLELLPRGAVTLAP